MTQKLLFSTKASFFILEILRMITYVFFFLARLNIISIILIMLFYLFHDKWINTFDLFIDYWIKYQLIIIDNFLFDIVSYLLLGFCYETLIWPKFEKYDELYYFNLNYLTR